jgi:hypothetical protein
MAEKASKNLTAEAVTAMEYLKSRDYFSRMGKWTWEDSRNVLWLILRDAVLPEVGFNPAKAASDPAVMEELKAARAAFDKVIGDGYLIESSNLGKHVEADGYFKANEAKTRITIE